MRAEAERLSGGTRGEDRFVESEQGDYLGSWVRHLYESLVDAVRSTKLPQTSRAHISQLMFSLVAGLAD